MGGSILLPEAHSDPKMDPADDQETPAHTGIPGVGFLCIQNYKEI